MFSGLPSSLDLIINAELVTGFIRVNKAYRMGYWIHFRVNKLHRMGYKIH